MPRESVSPPVVARHDPAWQTRGSALAHELRQALAPRALRVEHIGSTAIPGMAAKPVLDLQISVRELREAARAFDRPLAERGFARTVFEQDHVPAGREDPPELWRKRVWTRRAHPGGDVNLHARVIDAPNERLALLFRDWFRAHPEAVPAYARFKSLLADAVGDPGLYTDVKDPVVDLIVTVAESWAADTSWTPPPPL
ncbi:GrpB family protein [Streptomyces sodiiphilus]